MNELKAIREALNLSQTEMGDIFGVKQGVYQRWEVAANSPRAKEITEKAKEIYRKKKGRAWEAVPADQGDYVNRVDFLELKTALKIHIEYWERGEEKVLKRLEELGQRIAALEAQAKR